MSDGIYINGKRPKTKKEVKDAFAADPASVVLEGTSLFEPVSGPLDELPVGTYHFVGPDPYSKRNFYGTITITFRGERKVTIK